MNFEFATAGRIVFGAGTFSAIGPAARGFGRRAFVVTGQQRRHHARLDAALASAGVTATEFTVTGEPTTDDVERAVAAARAAESEFVLGIGGGSVIDTAKAVSAMLTNPGTLDDYLEVVGRAQPLTRAAAPCIAIPTTAGTGAEVTRNSVLASRSHRVKVSLRSPLMLPRVALVDSELTLDLPPAITATTGLDALTQLIEPYVCTRANPLTDGFCREGLTRVGRSLRRAVDAPRDAAARDDMALASLCGGLALANAGLGAVHGFAGPIGGAFPAPHGAVCAILLPDVVATNVRALRERSPGHASLQRYEEVARLLVGRAQASPPDLVEWLRRLVSDLQIPNLAAHGISRADIPALVTAAGKASSMKANPVVLTPAECEEILTRAL